MSAVFGCPWRIGRRYSQDSHPIEILHAEIEDYYTYISATPEEQTVRINLLDRLTNIIHAKWPQARVEVFGSFPIGLNLPDGDMDLAIIGKWNDLPLKALARALLDSGVCYNNVKVIDRVKVPLVKMTDKTTSIKVDISFNTVGGVETIKILKKFIDTFPELPKLVLVLKLFLAQRNINQVYRGGISSYSLNLMVISFLQLRRKNFKKPTTNLGILLMEFFELYGSKFDYVKTAIRVKEGGSYITKAEVAKNMTARQKPGFLCIEDPLTPGNDVSCGSYRAWLVKSFFLEAFDRLKGLASSPWKIPPNISVLGSVIQIGYDFILRRNSIKNVYFTLLYARKETATNHNITIVSKNTNNNEILPAAAITIDSKSALLDSTSNEDKRTGHSNPQCCKKNNSLDNTKINGTANASKSISSGSTRKIQRTADPSDCNDHQNCQPNTSGKRQNPDNDEYHFNNIWAPPNKR